MATISNPLLERPSTEADRTARCRFCGSLLRHTFVDLGMTPLCESYVTEAGLRRMEPYYPLHVYVCESCLLVQLEEFESPEQIFSEYAYFSSYSDSWVEHARIYCERMIQRFGLTGSSKVVEVASNDGYLLQWFIKAGIPSLGIEPAANIARVAVEKGIPTLTRFLGRELAAEMRVQGQTADLVVGNNVLAQVPDLNDFVAGLAGLLAPQGVLTLEFPHLLKLIEHNEFDTIYHEHFSYFSLYTTQRILEAHGLRIFDVEELRTHGGSLRVFACLAGTDAHQVSPAVERILADEAAAGGTSLDGYRLFGDKVGRITLDLLEFLVSAKRAGKKVVGYGAPGKGTTLLHACGIGRGLLEWTVDRSPYKQGRFMPGNHIPIFAPERIAEAKPDYVLILPWNLAGEIADQLSYIRAWGGQFVVAIPELRVF